MNSKTAEWRPGPSVCRCCLSEGCYKDISTEYFWMGKREVYAEMLADTFDLTISYSKSKGPNSNSRLICEPCISRLRDATDFKRQVRECERTFLQHLDPEGSSDLTALEVTAEPLSKLVKLEEGEEIKEENLASDFDDADDIPDFGDDDDDDDLDDQPLTTLASKTPKKESVDFTDLLDNAKAEKRKSSSKAKASPAKKVKTKKEKVVAKPKPEKKKKGNTPDTAVDEKPHFENDRKINDKDAIKARKRNAMVLLEFTRIIPFRWLKNLYICFFCEEKFADPALLRQHNTSEHRTLSLNQLKLVLSKLKKHELIKVDVTYLGCKLCDEEIDNFDNLKLHLLSAHKKNIDPKSNDGVLPFRVTKDEFKCTLCDAKYDEFKTLNQHMNVHFQNFICEECGSGFITPERLRTHAFSHETGSFPCESCDKVFRSSNSKKEHHATVHMQVKRHRCPVCSETFRNYFQRNKHISSVHGMKLKEFKCSMCPKVFTLSGKLGVHIRTVHLKMKRHACNVCEWKFYSKSELKDHMIKHGGERKFQCNVCKKGYARKYTLREHMRIHENDRRFVCTICGRSFVQKCSLKHHAKVHHPNASRPDGFNNVVPLD